MRDRPRPPNPGETPDQPQSQDSPSRISDDNKSDRRQSLRDPDAPSKVNPEELQALLDYRDERARLEQTRRRQDGSKPPNLDAAKDESNESRLRQGAAQRADPHDLQSLLDYRAERARAERARLRDPQKDLQSLLDYRDERARLERSRIGRHDPNDRTQPQGAVRPADRDGRQPTADDAERTTRPAVEPKTPGTAREVRDLAVTEDKPGAPRHSPNSADSHPKSRTDDQPNRTTSKGDNPNIARPEVGRAEQTVEPELADLVRDGWRSDAESNDRRVPRLSNRDRPPRDGDVNYNVDVPHDWSQSITDIDLVKGGTLWEVKKVTGRNPQMDTETWVDTHLRYKLDKYVEARQYMEGYEDAPLGLIFIRSDTTERLRRTVESAVADWMNDNPSEDVKVRWAK